MTDLAQTFSAIARGRRSVRRYLPDPVPADVLREVLTDAQFSPSNCNTQPWFTHIVSGATLQTLGEQMRKARDAVEFSPDFSWDAELFAGRHGERRRAQGAAYYEALGVARDDVEGRRDLGAKNLEFFGAPHLALLFMPQYGDGVRVAADVGMYAQTLLLSLHAHGLAGVPQTSVGRFAEPARRVLGLNDDQKLLFGISFGYPDTSSSAAHYDIGRDEFDSCVRFHN